MRVTTTHLRQRVAELDGSLRDDYKSTHPPKDRDWTTYEQQWAHRIREVMHHLGPLLREACRFTVIHGPGRPPAYPLETRTTVLLLKALFGQSNRRMAGMVEAFSLLSDIHVSYKAVERLYSDSGVLTAIENLHRQMLA